MAVTRAELPDVCKKYLFSISAVMQEKAVGKCLHLLIYSTLTEEMTGKWPPETGGFYKELNCNAFSICGLSGLIFVDRWSLSTGFILQEGGFFEWSRALLIKGTTTVIM